MSALDLGLRILVDPEDVRAFTDHCARIERGFAAGEDTERRRQARDLALACAEENLFECMRVEPVFT